MTDPNRNRATRPTLPRGFTHWNGTSISCKDFSKPQIPPEHTKLYDIILRDGSRAGPEFGSCLDWQILSEPTDIIAYRVCTKEN